MLREVLIKLFKSLGITLGVAATLGYCLSVTAGSFWPWFLTLIVLQFIIFYIVGEIVKNKNNKIALGIELKRLELVAQQSTNVVCPCDRRFEATVQVKLDRENSYTCLGCNKQIGIKMEAKTALLTSPVTVNPLDTPLLSEHIKKLVEQQT